MKPVSCPNVQTSFEAQEALLSTPPTETNEGLEMRTWYTALQVFKQLFEEKGLDVNLLQRYSLKYYYAKFFCHFLLSGSRENASVVSQRRLPLMCVRIREAHKRQNVATVILTDGTAEIKTTLSQGVVEAHWSRLAIGTTLLISEVSVT